MDAVEFTLDTFFCGFLYRLLRSTLSSATGLDFLVDFFLFCKMFLASSIEKPNPSVAFSLDGSLLLDKIAEATFLVTLSLSLPLAPSFVLVLVVFLGAPFLATG